MKIDIETSVRILSLTEIIVKECFSNCVRVVMRVDEFMSAAYVEGWYYPTELQLPIKHAWLEHERRIIDPTMMQVLRSVGKPYTDEETLKAGYFPAFRIRGRKSVAVHMVTHPFDPDPPYFNHFTRRMKKAYQTATASRERRVMINGHRHDHRVSAAIDILKMPSPMEEKTIGQRLADLRIEGEAVLAELEDEEQPDNEYFEVDRESAVEFLEALLELTDPPSEIASLVVAIHPRCIGPSALENARDITNEFLALDKAIPNGAGGEWYSEEFVNVIGWIQF
jgi:hypothetical protein